MYLEKYKHCVFNYVDMYNFEICFINYLEKYFKHCIFYYVDMYNFNRILCNYIIFLLTETFYMIFLKYETFS